MNLQDAIRQETRVVGNTVKKSQPGYVFLCSSCGDELWVTNSKIKRGKGYCKNYFTYEEFLLIAETLRLIDHRRQNGRT
jgi:hypothetical protein